MILQNLQKIYNHFLSENILICGSLCDVYWIGYTDVIDIDLIINKSSLKKFFNIPSLNYHIKQDGFDIKQRVSNKYK